MADALQRRCRGCAAVLPAGSRLQRLTCSAMCRKRWSRPQRRAKARAALEARYPGMTPTEISRRGSGRCRRRGGNSRRCSSNAGRRIRGGYGALSEQSIIPRAGLDSGRAGPTGREARSHLGGALAGPWAAGRSRYGSTDGDSWRVAWLTVHGPRSLSNGRHHRGCGTPRSASGGRRHLTAGTRPSAAQVRGRDDRGDRRHPDRRVAP